MSDVEADIDAAQNGVLIRALPLATVIVRGPDRTTWLNGLTTCDLSKLKPGDAAYGLFVAKNGKIVTELYALLGNEDVLLGVRQDTAEELVTTLDRYLVMEDAELGIAEGERTWLAAFGAQSERAIDAARGAGARAGLIRRNDLTAAVFTVGAEDAAEVTQSVITACPPARPASDEGWSRVRVEHGIPEHGVDFDDTNYPQEAALERDAVSFAKGCYLGQEAVFMLEKRGHVKKRLVQLLVEGPVSAGDPIATPEGIEVGKVTSAITRPWRNVALGTVKYKQAKADTALKILSTAQKTESPATVTELLAIKPEA